MKPQQSKKSPSLSQVRIIGGEYRRRLVAFIDADGLRPTPDRLRETLFNWLTHDLPNANVLDCCAGSGVLSFEALSRGAKMVTMIEPNFAQYHQLTTSSQTLNISPNKLHLVHATAQQALPTLAATFDIVLLDPPYDLEIWLDLLALIKKHSLIHTDSIIYIEANQPLDQLLATIGWLEVYKKSKVGQIYAGLYKVIISKP